MHTSQFDLSIIIPAYLEEENLRILLPRLTNSLSSLKIRYEVIVVDTMKPLDNTALVSNQFNATYINRENGNAYGDAIRTGIKFIKGEKAIFMDGDGSHSPEFISQLYKHANDYDVVIASRYVSGGSTDNNKILLLMSKIVNFVYSFVLNIKCKDVSNSFKLYDTNKLQNLLLKSNNFDIVEEILFKLNKKNKNLKIIEIPFTFKERMFGHTKRNLFLFVLSYIFTLIKLRFSN